MRVFPVLVETLPATMQAIENESRSMDRAERLAAESDTVVLVVGWGGDRCFFFVLNIILFSRETEQQWNSEGI